MSKRFKEESGFTLVEVLIAVAIIAIISITLVQLFSGSNQIYHYSVSQSQNAMVVQSALTTIVSELKYIDVLNTPTLGDSGSQAEYTISGTSGKIYLDGDDIVFKNNGVETKRLAEGQIQVLTFKRDNVNLQKMTITLSTRSSLAPNSQPLTVSTTVMMLNL